MFVVGPLIIAAVLLFVAWPLFSGRGRTIELPPDEARSGWERQKAEAYGAIREAEFDYRMGKLSDADLGALRDKYTARALEAIAALDREHEKAAPSPPARPLQARIAFCPSCGSSLPKAAKFCPRCGDSLEKLGAVA